VSGICENGEHGGSIADLVLVSTLRGKTMLGCSWII
jgi:hypothetical protein